MLSDGIITKINSDTYTVRVNNSFYDCKARGKFRNDKVKPFVGDNVKVDLDTLVISEVLERKNFLLRPPVANIDIALIVTSIVKPNLSLNLLDKLISIIRINKIEPVIVLTKLDLCTKNDLIEVKKLVKYYESIGIKVFTNKKIRRIKKHLKNKIVTVCGQTGAGKSTLLNKFDKHLYLNTDEISEALGRGKHTTRIVELFQIDKFSIVDTPGFSSIDIDIYSEEEIRNSFQEFSKYTCKFKDCKHLNEMGCSIKNNENILSSRYENYKKFLGELK